MDTRYPLEIDDEPSRPFAASDALDPLDEFMADQAVIPRARTVSLQEVLAQSVIEENDDDAEYEEFKRHMNRITQPLGAIERADALTL